MPVSLMKELPPVYVITSSYGHRFTGTDSPDRESCLTCGAMYALLNLGAGYGEYHCADGGTPAPCTGDTRMAHGYPGERHCQTCPPMVDTCRHTRHDCPCLFCD